MFVRLKIPFCVNLLTGYAQCSYTKCAFRIRMYEEEKTTKIYQQDLYLSYLQIEMKMLRLSLSYQISNFIAELRPNRITEVGCVHELLVYICILCAIRSDNFV